MKAMNMAIVLALGACGVVLWAGSSQADDAYPVSVQIQYDEPDTLIYRTISKRPGDEQNVGYIFNNFGSNKGNLQFRKYDNTSAPELWDYFFKADGFSSLNQMQAMCKTQPPRVGGVKNLQFSNNVLDPFGNCVVTRVDVRDPAIVKKAP